jgi:cyclophilin family peptidyl-prolyl cis-trans isomerase/HEAT repeat protein
MKDVYYILLLLLVSCGYQSDQMDQLQASDKFDSPVRRKIAEWQDHRQIDSLIQAIESHPEYRIDIAMALASVQDSKAIPALSSLLSHIEAQVRQHAAYALGQTYDTTAFKPLITRLPNENDSQVKSYLLEALGKVASESQLHELLKFVPSSPAESEGYAWALYKAGLRGIFNINTTRSEINILDTASSIEAQLAAAHYLSRVRILSIPSSGFKVLNKEYPDAEVRMAVALAFNKTPPLVAINGLRPLFKDEDYRVRINAVRAIPDNKINDYTSFLDTLLSDVNVNTAIAAATKIISTTGYLDSAFIDQWLQKKSLNWRVEALLLQAAIKKDPANDSRIEQVKRMFISSNKPYRKAVLLSALSHTFRAHEFLVTETFKATHPAVSTSGIEALVKLRSMDNFPDVLKPTFTDVLHLAVNSGDAAMIDIASTVLRNPDLNFKNEIKDPEFLRLARQRLQLPRHNETLQSLEKTIAFFENRPPQPVVNTFNHPINWEKVSSLKGRHQAVIETGKGEIQILLFTNKAPGSVLNFVELAQSGYYNNKVFHRVVPNFVAQGGGNRGDGWGNEDYSIRSEFSDLKFTTGTIGMASAGKDTEGTQWFITHSPTPHLEGRYTIFARVEKGMEVVHQLEQGDFIYNVKIK